MFFGGLSDKIGRKPIILMGCLLAAVSYFSVFSFLTETANPALFAAQQARVTISADPRDCAFQFNPLGTATFTTSCDKVKLRLLENSVHYTTLNAPAGSLASVQIGPYLVVSFGGAANAVAQSQASVAVQMAATALEFARKTASEDF